MRTFRSVVGQSIVHVDCKFLQAGPKIDGLVLKFLDGHFLKMNVI